MLRSEQVSKKKQAARKGASAKADRKPRRPPSPRARRLGPRLEPPAPRDVSESRVLALAAIEAALDKKALLPVLIDVSAMASYTDFIGIVSGRSDRQVESITENVRLEMKARGRHTLGQEGSGGGRWMLLDFGDVVIHVFHHPVREFYDLESLWIDAPRVHLDVPPEAQISDSDALYAL